MHLIWLEWSLLWLGAWLVLFLLIRDNDVRKEVLGASILASVFGLTEPIFVPRYWNPPSLFNLAQTTGFDLESFIFAFGVGGIVVGLFERIFSVHHRALKTGETRYPRNTSLIAFTVLVSTLFISLLLFLPINPIYSTIIIMVTGGLLIVYLRPDLWLKLAASSLLFTAFYLLYFLWFVLYAPGYVVQVWNIQAISGSLIAGIPPEEILFALGFGFFWSGIYDFYAWRKVEVAGFRFARSRTE
jgi:hypothetical protein